MSSSSRTRGSDSMTKSRPGTGVRRSSLELDTGTDDCRARCSRSARILWLFARSSATSASTVEVRAVLSPDAPAFTSETRRRSEEHTSELQSLMRISYAVFCLKKKKINKKHQHKHQST